MYECKIKHWHIYWHDSCILSGSHVELVAFIVDSGAWLLVMVDSNISKELSDELISISSGWNVLLLLTCVLSKIFNMIKFI